MIASFLSLFELLFLSALQMQVTTFIHVHIISCTPIALITYKSCIEKMYKTSDILSAYITAIRRSVYDV